MAKSPPANLDQATVAGFGREWAEYDQTRLTPHELQWMFDSYFHIFPFDRLPPNAHRPEPQPRSNPWALGGSLSNGKM